MKLINQSILILLFSCVLSINSFAQNIQKEENWSFYISKYNDIEFSNFLDLELVNIAPVSEVDQLLAIKIKLKHPQKDGLPSYDEHDDLVNLEDKLLDILLADNLIYFAGRTTANGQRIFYFYTNKNFNLAKTKQQLTSSISNYFLDITLENDKDWNHYLNFLYPDENEIQMIQNLDLITFIEEQGDDLSKEREISHWIYFKSTAHRNKFKADIKSYNFNVIAENYDKELGDYPYSLTISRSDFLDWKNINDITIELMNLAKTHEGEYDGWESKIVK
ncbi:MAG: DUF695 domain-containing protein [Weeksellaceae bacterium]|nr:DUF695 domain-containing protein [Weeksellaceae bacterium]